MITRSLTPYVETEVLLALLDGDEELALTMVADMLPFERVEFAKVASRLATITNAHHWCSRCDTVVAILDSVTTFGKPGRTYHRACLSAERAEESAHPHAEPSVTP